MTKLYTVKQASKVLNLSTNTVYKYLNEGVLKSSRASAKKGRFRITQKSLEEFLGVPIDATPIIEQLPQPPVQAIPTIQLQTYQPTFSLQATRVLILLSFILLIIESFTSKSFSLNSQILRLTILLTLFLLAYQFRRER